MKGKYCIFLLFILVALISCNDPKPVTDTLHRAEALMNEYPDSAWTLLNTISPDEMEQNRNRALYALLYTQAQDKTYRDETNDSLISVAVDYYRNTEDVRHKFLFSFSTLSFSFPNLSIVAFFFFNFKYDTKATTNKSKIKINT